MAVRFVWDPRKDRLNQQKHGVAFAEAATVFHNEPFVVFHDPDHSEREDRYPHQ